jgi:hypothetical protein
MGDQRLTIAADPVGSWWRVRVGAGGPRPTLSVPELGEPLIRLIVETHLDGWLDASHPDHADFFLPALKPR